MANSCYLPENVMVEILSWLPAESLVRFQIVRKSWQRLINHPKFIAKHLVNSLQLSHISNSNSNSSTTILVKRAVENERSSRDCLLSLFSYPIADDSSVVDIDFPCFKDLWNLQIRGHSHGLVCLSDLHNHIFLCNPATRELRLLPPPLFPQSTGPIHVERCVNLTRAVGFGYDPKSKDFKVVRIVDISDVEDDVYYPAKVEVYELSRDCWREIHTPVPGYHVFHISFEMFYKGMYYWCIGFDDDEIVVFDMSEEVFHTISVPEPEHYRELRERHKALGVLNGSIVRFHYTEIRNTRYFDIFAMEKDESGGFEWSKLMRIGSVTRFERPLLIVRPYQLLVESNGQLFSYHLKTKEIKQIPIPIPGHLTNFQAFVFPKSLLSVKGGNLLNLEDF